METEEKTHSISYGRELFPSIFGPQGELWSGLFSAHGMEVRDKPFRLFWERYYEIQRQNRLFWIVARRGEKNEPIGYSCHWIYRDMHFGNLVGADDLWYVTPELRGLGIGRKVREIGLAYLKEAGATDTYDMIRDGGPSQALENLGYEFWGSRWVKKI